MANRNQNGYTKKNNRTIDRFALVCRHNIEVNEIDLLSSLTVGNGEFAFTTDITGLQTFYAEYEKGIPLGTQSNWGWHTNPNTGNYERMECEKWYYFQERKVPYSHQIEDNDRGEQASYYFRENPHRLHLGLIRLYIEKKDGTEITPHDIINPCHKLNLWTGEISSTFKVGNKAISVQVFCHQEKDLVSAKIESSLIAEGNLAVEWYFPCGVPIHIHSGYDFSHPEKHMSHLKRISGTRVDIHRVLDDDSYTAAIQWKDGCKLVVIEKHKYRLQPKPGTNSIEFSCLFSPEELSKSLPDYSETKKNNSESWEAFWQSGGAIDFSECKDPRAFELERRTILSQYLIKVNSSGKIPPAETGLTYNSWYGKFHLEMHWWHSVHFVYWGRSEYLEKQMSYYESIYNVCVAAAGHQGFKGVRWPKMTCLQGMNSPSGVGSYLIWQQPHYIYFAEILYTDNPTEETLKKYCIPVFETAEFMADFAQYDSENDVYNLLPPLIPAQELWPLETTSNPPFELSQWNWALNTAIKWKERLHQPVNPKWKEVVEKLAAPDIIDGFYPGIAGAGDSYTSLEKMKDHPMVLGACGMMPYWNAINIEIMKKTFTVILDKWDWLSTWGWDFPLTAMSAVSLEMPEKAIDILLMNVQKNTYLKNGHNYQNPRLRVYLPGNGGFLTAMALMCAGREGDHEVNPGFPKNGEWDVKWEGLKPVL